MTNETQYPNPNGKSFSYFEFQRRWNPFRSPAWRFQWAQELAESDRSLPTEEGDVRALAPPVISVPSLHRAPRTQ